MVCTLQADKPITATFDLAGDGSIIAEQPTEVTVSLGQALKLKAKPSTTIFRECR